MVSLCRSNFNVLIYHNNYVLGEQNKLMFLALTSHIIGSLLVIVKMVW